MKKLAIILSALLFMACGENFSEFQSIDIDAQGIEIEKNKQTGIMEAMIPAGGCEFSLKGKGKNMKYAWVTSISIDGRDQSAEGINNGSGWYPPRPDSDNPSLYQGSWGEFEYLTDEVPYDIMFKIGPNDRGSQRVIRINLGYGYVKECVELVQSAIKHGTD